MEISKDWADGNGVSYVKLNGKYCDSVVSLYIFILFLVLGMR